MSLQRAQLPNFPGISLPGYTPNRNSGVMEAVLAQAASQLVGQLIANASTEDLTNVAVDAGDLPEEARRGKGFFSKFKDPLTAEEYNKLKSGKLDDDYRRVQTALGNEQLRGRQMENAQYERLMAQMAGVGTPDAATETSTKEGVETVEAGKLGIDTFLKTNPVTKFLFGEQRQPTPEAAQRVLDQGGTGGGKSMHMQDLITEMAPYTTESQYMMNPAQTGEVGVEIAMKWLKKFLDNEDETPSIPPDQNPAMQPFNPLLMLP